MVLTLGRARGSRGAYRPCRSRHLLARGQTSSHRLLGQYGAAVGRSDRRRSRDARGTQGPCLPVAFSPDGKRVLTGSADKTARLWDAATGAAVATLQGHTNYVVAGAFSPDGKGVLTGSRDKTAKLWSAFPSAQAVIDVVKAFVPRCLTPRSASVFICERCRDGAMPATYGLTLTTDRRKRRLQPTLRPFPADLG